ncbi:MAG: hypothetical protein L0Z70_07290 [Chloroflexi bacterium]|nr:hypothetical protein [Chloroflexota bacterium]
MNAKPDDNPGAPLGSSTAIDPSQTPTLKQSNEERPWLWQGKIAPAFWTVASVFSLTMNVVLIVLVIILGRQLFALKDLVAVQLVGGLHENFVKMDEARITAKVPVSDTIPVQFNLPVTTNTIVRLTEDTRIKGARVNLRTGGLTISDAPANIVLPAGAELPIALSINVPVDTSIPVQLTVEVDIPLSQTELHEPFVGLQDVVSPYNNLLRALPASWQETPLCGPLNGWLCK